jgi:DNA-binding response OmpR family regulator
MTPKLVTKGWLREASKPAPVALNTASFTSGGRQKFIVGFQAAFETLELLLARSQADPSARQELHRQVHRLADLAGSVGFPTVCKFASSLEEILNDDARRGLLSATRCALESMRQAYTADLASPPPSSSPDHSQEAAALKVLVVDDEPEQRELLTTCLLQAGHRPLVRDTAVDLLECARMEQPSVVLLDVDMPGMDGYGACLLLKADPDTSGIPVVLMSTRATLDDRLAGLSLGADDYLCKPIDARELLLRLRVLGARREAREAGTTRQERQARPARYEAFTTRARAQLARSSGSVAIVRLPTYQADAAWSTIQENIRRRDVAGWYDQSHLVLLFPEMSPADARDRLTQIIERLPFAVGNGMRAGVTFAPLGTSGLEDLMAEADEALADAHRLGVTAAVKSIAQPREARNGELTVLVADDDPDVSRILDAHVQAAGYRTVLAFDGEDAVRAIETSRPDALVLDTMLPKMTGLDVLETLERLPAKPSVLVLSDRSREDDIARAFELGADDYVTKPFDPSELVARLSRVLR